MRASLQSPFFLSLTVFSCHRHSSAKLSIAALALDLPPCVIIFNLVYRGILNPPVNLFPEQSRFVISDSDFATCACGLLHRKNVLDTIGINFEAACDLRNTSGCWRKAIKCKLSQLVVILSFCSLTLVNWYQHRSLVIQDDRVVLVPLCGNDSISWNHNKHLTPIISTPGPQGTQGWYPRAQCFALSYYPSQPT